MIPTRREIEQGPLAMIIAQDMKVPLKENLTQANIQPTDFNFLLILVFCDLWLPYLWISLSPPF